MPAIGGLEAASNLARVVGEYYGEIYPTWAQVYNRFNKGKGKQVGTRGFELAIEKTPVSTHGFPADGQDLPAGESVKTLRPMVFATNMVGAVRLTKAAMDDLASRRSDDNYVNDWAETNFDNMIRSLHSLANIYCCGNGTGRLATISTGATSATQTVSNNDNTRFLRYGMKVSIVDPATFAVRGSAKITSDPAPGDTTFTMDASIASTTGDFVVIYGGANRVFTGLGHIIDDGTLANPFFQNENRSSIGRWKANLLNADSGSFSQSQFRALLGAKLAPSVGTVQHGEYEIWSHEAQYSSAISLGWNLKQFTGDSKTLKLGYRAMEVEGIPWVVERDYDKTVIDLIPWKYTWKFMTKPWHWDETTGSMFNRVINVSTGAQTGSFEAFYGTTCNFGTPDPRRFARIHTLTVPSDFALTY